MSTHGGKRRRHVLPALSPQQVLQVRYMRSLGIPYAELIEIFGVSRETLGRAATGRKTYKGFA